MQRTLIPPHDPSPQSIRPPMIYVEKQLKWEYKQIARNLESEKPLDETELNALGEEGWELTGLAQQPPITYFYFRRQIEK
jgi:hypothetical protein